MSNKAKVERELADRVMARRRLLHFIKRLDPKYMAGWVHEDICRRLERFSDDVAKGLSPRLMLLMPPRHGKSRIASQSFPAWHLGRHPDHEFIAASYNVALAMVFSRKVQSILEHPKYPFEGTTLDPNNRSAESWGLAANDGVYIAAGVNGGVTGKGAHILVIDDPIKNAEEADSAVAREALWDWYTSTAYTRLAPGGGVLVIQTCWHDDDLAGRLQQVMAANRDDGDVDKFEIVRYPAVADCDEWIEPFTEEIVRVEVSADDRKLVAREDVVEPTRLAAHRSMAATRAAKAGVATGGMRLLRAVGEPLHPERYDLPKLMKIMRTLSARFWSALYQQNPVPEDGNFFTRDQFKRALPPPKEACNVFITFDFAITEKQTADWTVGSVGLQDDEDILHKVDSIRMKSGDAFFLAEAICALVAKWRTPNMRLGFEDGQIFRGIQAPLKKLMRKKNLVVAYELLQPVTDKKVRASPLQARMQQGRMSFSTNAPWFDATQNEYLRFPSGVNDDIVDADAWLARLADGHAAPRKARGPKVKSWKSKIARAAPKGETAMAA